MLAPILLAAGGGTLLGSLFMPWANITVFFGSIEDLSAIGGWELFDWADVVFAALGVLLGVLSIRPPRRRWLLAAVALLCAAAIATTVGHGFPDTLQRRGGSFGLEPALGPYLAIGALAAAIAGLAVDWLRPRAPAARAA